MKAFLKKNKNLLIGIAIIAVFIILDIVSKIMAKENLMGKGVISVIPKVFDFYYIENTGGAFGFFSDAAAALTVLIVVTSIASVALAFGLGFFSRKSLILSIGLSLLFVGAVGNLIDRLMQGYVVDFIRFAFWPQFAVFNVADIAVTFGLVFFTIYLLFIYVDPKSKKGKKTKKGEQSELNADTKGGETPVETTNVAEVKEVKKNAKIKKNILSNKARNDNTVTETKEE